MNILVLGGNRLIGRHLTGYLIGAGHNVTIANRGLSPDPFGGSVGRIILERTSAESISDALTGKYYDIVYDSLALSSNDVKCLLDVLECGRYIMTSSVSVYPRYKTDMQESDFEPEEWPLKWCWRRDDTYSEVKRQAECALYQIYSHIPSVAVRFPFVAGDDDHTKRLHFYVEHIIKSLPMSINNSNGQMSFIISDEAGRFLAWLAANDFCGKINAGSRGTASICDIIRYIEGKSGVKALYSPDGDTAPYNGTQSHSMNLQRAANLGFEFSDVHMWIYELLDRLISQY